jgi:hypothetical protein
MFGHQIQEILCSWISKLTEFVEGPENELNGMRIFLGKYNATGLGLLAKSVNCSITCRYPGTITEPATCWHISTSLAG